MYRYAGSEGVSSDINSRISADSVSATPPVTVACIPFLNQLSLHSKSNYVVRIVLIRDTCDAAARGEGGLRDDEGARGGGSGELLVACGGANGPTTRADQGLCVATRGSCHAQPTRPKRATHEGENEGEKKDIFILTQHARMPQPPHATTFCLQNSISRSHSHTRGGQWASERDRTAATARERRKIDVFGRLC